MKFNISFIEKTKSNITYFDEPEICWIDDGYIILLKRLELSRSFIYFIETKSVFQGNNFILHRINLMQ